MIFFFKELTKLRMRQQRPVIQGRSRLNRTSRKSDEASGFVAECLCCIRRAKSSTEEAAAQELGREADITSRLTTHHISLPPGKRSIFSNSCFKS